MESADLLQSVITELKKRSAQQVAQATGISYDTVLRIRNSEGDPGYSKVRQIADYLFPQSPPAASDLPPSS